jgi:hypothetical protein
MLAERDMGRELATKIRPILQSGKIPDIVDDDLQIMFAGLMKEGLLRDLTSDFSTPAADGSDEPTTIRRRVGNPEWRWRVELPEHLDELRSRAGVPEFGDRGGWRICARRRAGRACGLSRASFRERDIITDVFAAGMGVPAALLIIPMYLMTSQMGLISSIPDC